MLQRDRYFRSHSLAVQNAFWRAKATGHRQRVILEPDLNLWCVSMTHLSPRVAEPCS